VAQNLAEVARKGHVRPICRKSSGRSTCKPISVAEAAAEVEVEGASGSKSQTEAVPQSSVEP